MTAPAIRELGHGLRRAGHVLLYPARGRVLFATDFHGQREDFEAVVATWQRMVERDPDTYLLFAGDFVHGPAWAPDEWPDWRADTYHADETPWILDRLHELMATDVRVQSLLGNHEHAHRGGPRTTKFHDDPDEVDFLETLLGSAATARLHDLIDRMALVALAPCGVLFMHAAPAVKDPAHGFAEVATVSLRGYGEHRILDIYDVPIVGELLWAKWAEPAVAAAFLSRMGGGGLPSPRVAIYGHDVIEEGVEVTSPNQIIVSTSFGVPRAAKTLCMIDLAGDYRSTDDIVAGRELVPLYPG